jgi:hypothetical protein
MTRSTTFHREPNTRPGRVPGLGCGARGSVDLAGSRAQVTASGTRLRAGRSRRSSTGSVVRTSSTVPRSSGWSPHWPTGCLIRPTLWLPPRLGSGVVESRPFGGTFTLDAPRRRLGINTVLTGRPRDTEVTERVLFALVANRALAPSYEAGRRGLDQPRAAASSSYDGRPSPGRHPMIISCGRSRLHRT